MVKEPKEARENPEAKYERIKGVATQETASNLQATRKKIARLKALRLKRGVSEGKSRRGEPGKKPRSRAK